MIFCSWKRIFQRCYTRAITGNNINPIRDARPPPQAHPVSRTTRRCKTYDIQPSLSTKDATDATYASQPPATSAPKRTRKKTPPEVLASKKYWGFPVNSYTKKQKLKRWNALGPPPLSEYRLTFGRHQGELLADVPHSYVVKYLIPRHESLHADGHCPIVFDAVTEYLKKHPELKSQAGNRKTRPVGDATE